MGPLTGLRVIEMAGIGPVPFAAMLLADQGADVVRVDRPVDRPLRHDPAREVVNRGRRSVAVDLKHPDGTGAVLRLVEQADALIEGFRPGVMERLGLGPEACHARNRRLVYGRMTGWGGSGPRAQEAGHDINYLAIAGVLGQLRRPEHRPMPPLNLVGDYGGGALYLVFGLMAAAWEADRTGRGQVVDAGMVDGAASLLALVFGEMAQERWAAPGENFLDTAAPWYDVYETADGGHFAVGALEGRFHRNLLAVLGLDGEDLPHQWSRRDWPALKARFAEVFRTRTRSEWEQRFAGSDACGAPVLSPMEAARHPHNRERGTFVEHHGVLQPAPAPRFSRTPGDLGLPPDRPGGHTDEVLTDWGFAGGEITDLRASGAIR